MSDPWSEFTPVEERGSSQPQPIFTIPDPSGERAEQREIERIRLSEEAGARDARSSDRSEETADREARRFELEMQGGGLTEGESKSLDFYQRTRRSNTDLERLNMPPEGLLGLFGQDVAPNVLARFSGDERRAARSAIEDFIAATLRRESGAAIGESEFERQYRIYFPQPGAGPEEIASKARARELAIRGMKSAAGPIGAQLAERNLIDLGYLDTDGNPITPSPEDRRNPTTPEIATTRDAINNGADVRLGMDRWGENNVFDRLSYLEETYGIGATQEARLSASLNNLSGQEVSSSQIAAIYGKLDIPLPEQSELDTMAESLRQGQRFSGFDTSDAEQQYLEGLRAFNENSPRGDEERLLQQGATWGISDEVAGAEQAIYGGLRGQNPITGYQVGRDAERLALEEARERQGAMGVVGEVGAGLATGGVRTLPALARTGVRAAPTAVNEARAAGAIAGYGYGEGAVESTVGAGVGAVTGDLAARGIGAIGQRLANRPVNETQRAGREVIEAADRTNARTGSNIQPIAADVAGPNIRRATSGTAQTTVGAAPIINASRRVNDEAAGAVDSIARGEGAPLTPQGGGERAIKGAEKTMKRLKTKVDANYTRARNLSGDTRVPLNNARATLDQHLAEVADTPGGSRTADTLADLREGMEGDWTPEGIRRMRTEWRDRFIKDGLRGTDQERRVNDIIDAAELDIEQGLVAAGKTDAAKAWKTASTSAAERYQLIDDVITPIIGKKADRSGEQAFGAIERLSRGDAAALGKFMKALPKEEAGAVRATVISRLGRATKGQQDADGQSFSLSRFLTNWNDEGLSPEAKGALFGGELRAALDDIARLAEGTKAAQGYANHSNTSGANWVQGALAASPLAFFDLATSLMVSGGALGVQNAAGRLLASPTFARWLARAGKVTTPGAATAHANSLTRVASSDAAIGAEIIDFQSALLRQLEGAPSRLAAEEDQGSGQNAASASPQGGDR